MELRVALVHTPRQRLGDLFRLGWLEHCVAAQAAGERARLLAEIEALEDLPGLIHWIERTDESTAANQAPLQQPAIAGEQGAILVR